MAMAAARVGEPQIAVEALLKESPRNRFDVRGINVGGPCPYLPGNGGLLYAVAMMAAGWDGAPDRPAPGFPADGILDRALGRLEESALIGKPDSIPLSMGLFGRFSRGVMFVQRLAWTKRARCPTLTVAITRSELGSP